MARFAKLGINGRVTDIIEVSDTNCLDSTSTFDAEIGRQWCESFSGGWSLWQAMTTNNFGDKNGYEYDQDLEKFKPVKPFTSWTWNNTSGEYDPPVARPSDFDSVKYEWNESGQSWDAV